MSDNFVWSSQRRQHTCTMLFSQLAKIRKSVFDVARKQGTDVFYYGNFIPNPGSRVMFVAEMPSSRKHDPHLNFQISSSDEKFTKLLCKHGFGGSYLTDIVKTATPARRPTKAEVNAFAPILIKEIEAVRPEMIVAIGKSAEAELIGILRGYPVFDVHNVHYVHHPSWCERMERSKKPGWSILDQELENLASLRNVI